VTGAEFIADRDLVQCAQAPAAVLDGDVEAHPAAGVQQAVPPVEKDRDRLVRETFGQRVVGQPGTEPPAEPV
jgi:hypothetical protein